MWAGFANIGDNVAVLVIIVTLLLLYLLIVVWARRADKREKQLQVSKCRYVGISIAHAYEKVMCKSIPAANIPPGQTPGICCTMSPGGRAFGS